MGDHVVPLPEASSIQKGSTVAKGPNYTVEVSNKAGYMCNIRLDSTFDVPPAVVFSIFTAQGEKPLLVGADWDAA